jgi:hypothetical protein
MDFEILFHNVVTNVDTCKDLVSKELVGFHWYLVNAQNCKCALSRWCKEKHKFPNIDISMQ